VIRIRNNFLQFFICIGFMVFVSSVYAQESAGTNSDSMDNTMDNTMDDIEVENDSDVPSENLKRTKPKKRKKRLKSKVSGWFPNWGTEPFDYSISPILGFKYTKVTTEEGVTDTATSEIGLALGVKGINLQKDDPTATIGTEVGYAVGKIITNNRVGVLEVDDLNYSRKYGNISLTVPVKAYRHVLTFSRGRKDFNEGTPKLIQSFGVTNDMGLKLKSWTSTHLTHTYLRVFSEKFDEQYFDSNDYWAHQLLSFKPFSTTLDFGPGVTNEREFATVGEEHSEISRGTANYFKANYSMNLIWKIGFSASGKYIISSTEQPSESFARLDLPEDSVYAPRSTPMPKDSLVATSLFGIPNLFAGFGLGWVYNLQILNLSEKEDTQRVTTKDNGFRLFFNFTL